MARKSRKKKQTPEELVDQFLAAPEEVVKDERELKKLKERKARDAARLERERATKSKQKPTLEDILADVVRVAEDEETNPWHEFRAISQRRYELYGHYPLEFLRKWGRFEHVKQMADLTDTPGTRRLLHVRTERSHDRHDERYMRRYIMPHLDKYPELTREVGKIKVGLSISDLHGFLLDPFTWAAFLDVCENMQPDVIYFNGDVIDGLDISTHPKVPGASTPLQLEFDMVRGLFRETRAVCPNVPLVWGAGNHFIDRLTRYLTQVARGLAGLRSLRLDKLLELDDLGVELVQGGSFVSPPGQRDKRPHKLLWDSYLVTHGNKLGKHPASAELAQWGQSGTSGHVHRASVHYGSTFAHRGLTWMSTPMSCVEDAGKWYVKGHAGWQKGFGVFFVLPGGRIHHYPVITNGGVATVEGHVFQAVRELPETEGDVKKFWLDRFDLDPAEYI